jgi:hypothetical protein
MKNIKIFMCLLFIAFTFRAQAQTTTTQDTLQIKLQGRNQVLYTGNSLEKLTKYHRGDSLKTLFFADLEKTLAAGTFAELPKRIHYFVNQQGKRRLKAEINEDAATKFDLAYEKKRMELDLPPLHYTIYDLPRHVEIHFLLEDSAAFEMVNQTELNKAIKTLHKDRNKLTGLGTYQVEQVGFGFEKRKRKKRQNLTIESTASLGALLLGNQPSPLLSFDMFMTIPLASNTVAIRLGGSYTGFMLTDFQDGRFGNINPGNFWDGSLQFSIDRSKNNWFGISFGQLSTEEPAGLPHNSFKFGLLTSFGENTLEYGFVDVSKNSVIQMITYKRKIAF